MQVLPTAMVPAGVVPPRVAVIEKLPAAPAFPVIVPDDCQGMLVRVGVTAAPVSKFVFPLEVEDADPHVGAVVCAL